MREKSPWTPRIADGTGPIYQRITAAIIEDVEAGKIPHGTRLPAQRDLAFNLGVGLGTITKSYNLLTRRGIAKAEKGRAMFVTFLPSQCSGVELNANVPPNLLSREMLSNTLAELSRSVAAKPVGAAEPYQGSFDHRKCLAAWLSTYCTTIEPTNMIICNGGQHAIWITLSVLKQKNTVILVDELPFQGLIWAIEKLGLEVSGVQSDSRGMRPDALEAKVKLLQKQGKNLSLYIASTAQNPTGISLSNSRIKAIAKICKSHQITIIEDDVYVAFSRRDHISFYELAPELVFYISSLAKVLSPWFRLGTLVVPSQFHAKALSFVSAQGSKVSPIMTEIVQHWITGGLAAEVAMMTHQEGIRRNNLAESIFEKNKNVWIGNGFHMFLPLTEERSKRLWQQAKAEGILLSNPSVNLLGNSERSGLRICLGQPTFENLNDALKTIATLHRNLPS